MLRVVLCNCSPKQSSQLAQMLIDERLAACVNIMPTSTSCYRWQGQCCTDQEQMLVIKTTPERYPAMKERLVEVHSYDVPEVIALDTDDVHQSYDRWVHEQTS